jgi:hypothetical protein
MVNRSTSVSPGSHAVAWLLALTFGLSTLIGWLSLPRSSSADGTIILILWLNIAVILGALGVEMGRRPYSLNLMHLVSMFLFLGAASLFQYSRGILGVPGPIQSVREQILPSALATTFWLTGYVVAYELRRLMVAAPRGELLTRPLTTSRVMLLSAFAIVGLFYLASVGLLGATTRGAAELAIEDFSLQSGAGAYSGTVYVLTTNIARALPPVSLLAALLLFLGDRRRRSIFVLIVVVVIGMGTLLVNNPFAATRMFLTCSLIAFTAPFVMLRFKTAWAVVLGITFGLTILPALGFARAAVSLDEFSSYLELMSPLQYLAASSDVDSLGMTALCQQWVDQFGHSWGRQIAGAFLFWIPRAIWQTKPIGTGAMVTQDLGFDFNNLAPPITAEALTDFGLPGTLVFGALFGWVLARIDLIYWAPGREAIAAGYRVIDAVYPFLLTCIVYYTRGDLFSAMCFAVSFGFWVVPLGFALRRTSGGALGSSPENRVDPS